MGTPSMEEKWQKKWEEARIFEANSEPGKKKFFIIFAYPGISGYLHVGHMRGYTYTDTIARFKRMAGYNVLFPVGTHATGNISINFAKKVARGDEKWIEYLKDNGCPEEEISKLGEPQSVVDYFNKVYVDEYWKKFGFLADWRRFTCTINPGYKRFIQWQFLKLNELGYLVQGPYFGTFCPVCGPVAVDASETDIQSGGNAEKQEYTLLKFKFGDKYLVAATLRPETVYGQTNFWADPELEYVKVKVGQEVWIVSKECAEKLSFQKKNIQVIGTIEGRDLLGRMCIAPVIHREIPVLPSKFCDPDVGTGLVTCVPSDAPYDWIALQDLKNNREYVEKYDINYDMVKAIEPIPIIRTKGYGPLPAKEICEKMGIKDQEDPRLEEATKEIYKAGFHKGVMLGNCAPYDGMNVEEVKMHIKVDLIPTGEVDVFVDLTEPVICRCGERVTIKRLEDQWFIKYSDGPWTKKAKEHAVNMDIQPPEYYQNLPSTLDWFQDRACVRLGDWLGTPFPLDKRWIIEPISDSTLYPIYYIVSMYENQGIIKPEQMTEAFFDHVFLGKGDASSVSESTGIPVETIEEVRKEVEYWYPLDINLGGKEHMTVHFPVFEMNHVAILPEKYWPKGIFAHWYIIGKGGKISKSKGGAVPIPNAAEKFGVDALRLYYCHVASPSVDVEWDEETVMNYKSRIGRIKLLLEQLTAMDGGDAPIDKWLESRMSTLIPQIIEAVGSFDLRTAANILYFDIPKMLRWYVRRGGSNKELLSRVSRDWVRLLCPFTPHWAEEFWSELGEDGLVSMETLPEPGSYASNLEAEVSEEYLDDVMADINEIIKVTGLKPKKVVLYTAPEWKRKIWGAVSEEQDIGNAIKRLMTDQDMRKRGKAIPKLVKQMFGDMRKMTPELRDHPLLDETGFLGTSSKQFLEKELECEVLVLDADNPEFDPVGKAKAAMPWRPAIYVE